MPEPKTAVVVPCYNTSFRCADVIALASPHADVVLAVDDGSTDDTGAYLEASGCKVLRLTVNGGKGAALAAAFREVLEGASGILGMAVDYVITIDGDGQHDPARIPAFIDCARRSGADLVLGVRDPDAMPRKNRIGAHFSRLLFLIGTSTFVADTQSGFRLHSRPLIAALIDRVTWQGYESESEVLWRTLAMHKRLATVEIPTIYIDGNRRTQFNAWRDSTRIASIFEQQLRWTVGMAMLDFAAFAVIVTAAWLSPAAANLASRAVAVTCQATLRRDFVPRSRQLVRSEGLGWCLLALAGHLALTTGLVGTLTGAGIQPIAAKALAQLAGYLASFAAVDRVLLGRVTRTCASQS